MILKHREEFTHHARLCVVIFINAAAVTALGQNNTVRWSAFDMGFDIPAASNTVLKSAAGQSFTGTTTNLNSLILIGFLSDTLFRSPTTAVVQGGNAGIPSTFELRQNYPNPFNPGTTIPFALPHESTVSLTVYNLLGQDVITLVNEVQPAGVHVIAWNGTNARGGKVSSGVYFYRMLAREASGNVLFTSLKKMIMLR